MFGKRLHATAVAMVSPYDDAPCKIDYEKALQRLRPQILKVRQDIAAFENMDDYSYVIDRTIPITLLGAMYAKLHELLNEEERILQAIDEEAAES